MADNTNGIIDVDSILFSDVNALTAVMDSLTANYRLLVGAAEELTRTPGAGQRTINLALDRVDNTGTLIDIVIFTLFIKLDFVAEVLSVSGIPINLLFALIQQIIEALKDPPLPRDPNNLLPRPTNPISPQQQIAEVSDELTLLNELNTEIFEEITSVVGPEPGFSSNSNPTSNAGSNSNPNLNSSDIKSILNAFHSAASGKAATKSSARTESLNPGVQSKWDRRFKQWEARQKKWEARQKNRPNRK